ncbi:MAG TPA: hypothetical protein VL635_03135 [Trinickia sp.]|nr:hypothetical protein [Trinickia sp.]
MKRRQFLGCLSAAASSYILAACGGGGTDATGAVAGAGANAIANAAIAVSPNGTTIPSATSITTNSGNVWTLSKGYVYKNGVKDTHAYNIAMLLWYNGAIYSQNTSKVFYKFIGPSWQQCLDPRLGGTSADNTAIPPATYIIDKSNNYWTMSNGGVFKNNVQDRAAPSAALLLWYGAMIYLKTGSGQFHVRSLMGEWLSCSDPRVSKPATAGKFYGINGHYDYPFTPTQTVAALQALGCTTYRLGCVNKSTQLNPLVAMAKAFQTANLELFTLVNYGLRDSTGTLYTSETAAYNGVFANAAAIAKALAPYGVTTYECGNELTRDPAIILNSTTAGTKATDFNNSNWPIMRGAIRGMIDGIKSVQPSARCGVNFCVADVAAADMLWDGKQPDGSTGHPQVRWDVTTWHNYSPYGDIFNIGTDGAGPGFNLPAYCKARYGVPFMITEWNAGPEYTEANRSTYVQTQMTEFYNARKSDQIESVMYYCLTSGDYTYGIVLDNLTPIQPTYGTFQTFVKQHADI